MERIVEIDENSEILKDVERLRLDLLETILTTYITIHQLGNDLKGSESFVRVYIHLAKIVLQHC